MGILFIQALPCWVTSEKLCFVLLFSKLGCFLLGVGSWGFSSTPLPHFVKHFLDLLLKNTQRVGWVFAPYSKELTSKFSSTSKLGSHIWGVGPNYPDIYYTKLSTAYSLKFSFCNSRYYSGLHCLYSKQMLKGLDEENRCSFMECWIREVVRQ